MARWAVVLDIDRAELAFHATVALKSVDVEGQAVGSSVYVISGVRKEGWHVYSL